MKTNSIFSSQKGGKHLIAHHEPEYTDSKTRQTLQTNVSQKHRLKKQTEEGAEGMWTQDDIPNT